ncbi:MAG: hypothetical protein EP152_01735 [Prevotella copri]|nr:hypothetical protein [Segatella copri]
MNKRKNITIHPLFQNSRNDCWLRNRCSTHPRRCRKGNFFRSQGCGKGKSKAAGWWITDKICQGGLHIYGKLWGTEDEEKKDNRTIFGDENASAKIQAGAKRYKRMARN